ncbi:TVP38/TMEM64 family protein [Polycladomyces subterraneus]|uniref:TVP38/TMEM64 family membrane protein n=1 Tax=Polycladomyces subterraneus TaxID=1016997 RepID=A0ABT8IQ70_9BACL|nr:VTT domain-containing protein [Polycladomyces subterraneus]MDN4594933.1 VTT domain-containing protein [Polycladomyces subterraneus]
MVSYWVDRFTDWGWWAVLVSIAVNGGINLVGFFPSVAITAANTLVWGPWLGGIVSWLGEMLGSAAAFFLYRLGVKKAGLTRHRDWKWVHSLNRMPRQQQLLSLILMRFTPFVPSGLVNMAASLTTMPAWIFLVATATGKIPSISLEILISYDVIHIEANYFRLGITLVVLSVGFWVWKRVRGPEEPQNETR